MVVAPERGVTVVDGLLTGWHEPGGSHLHLLEAVAGPGPLELAYRAALNEAYSWGVFGDLHLVLAGASQRMGRSSHPESSLHVGGARSPHGPPRAPVP
jgi:S-adenosylmethionine:tRNA ribosyltransferase-isomerase